MYQNEYNEHVLMLLEVERRSCTERCLTSSYSYMASRASPILDDEMTMMIVVNHSISASFSLIVHHFVHRSEDAFGHRFASRIVSLITHMFVVSSV